MSQEVKRVPYEELDYPGDGLYYLERAPFTGVAFYLAKDGWVESEADYQRGLLWGVTRVWFGQGILEREAQCAWGAYHGLVREWHPNGRPAVEAKYEYGVRVWGKRWDDCGILVEEFRLQEGDPGFRILKSARAAFGDAASDGYLAEPGSPAPS